jgi:UDP-N-acetylmuramoylalanine--D-glutamate ligase
LGKSGLSAFDFLKKKNEICLYDDNKKHPKNKKFLKNFISYKDIIKKKFDHIIISPGIDITKCKLSNYLKKNIKKINTDIDIFYSTYGNKNISITGTNGKSTTAKMIYNVLKDQNFDVRLVGNIGYPILSEKKVTKNTIFVIEVSSYQLAYSKLFKSDYAIILNIFPDHLERHKTFKNYIKTKVSLINNQTSSGLAFLDKSNMCFKGRIKKNKIKSKVIHVSKKIDGSILKKINNPLLRTDGNLQNISFVFKLIDKLGLNKKKFFKTINKFKGLNFRQQIIYKTKNLTIINDSKATSFSSTISLLKSLKNVYWILGGIPKKGDKLLLSKNDCKSLKAYIFGKNKKKFFKDLNKKFSCQMFENLDLTIKKVFSDIKNDSNNKHKILLFSPAAASFDQFKNFEDRGKYFNTRIKKILNNGY